ncbi:MAG: hypothetical protein OXC08_10495, partial [Thiotrichales bacterium]|nr:hypothetical protein [Thiotrichales bacterium]
FSISATSRARPATAFMTTIAYGVASGTTSPAISVFVALCTISSSEGSAPSTTSIPMQLDSCEGKGSMTRK